MTEGLGFQVKSDRDRVGLDIRFHAIEHGQKPIDRVGELTVLGRQRLDPVKSAVEYAVSVNY